MAAKLALTARNLSLIDSQQSKATIEKKIESDSNKNDNNKYFKNKI
jgi:hypothetical protein